MKATTILFCLLVLLAVFSVTDARRLAQKTRPSKAETNTADASRNLQGAGMQCFYFWDCYVVDIPGIGEEEVCDLVQKCMNGAGWM